MVAVAVLAFAVAAQAQSETPSDSDAAAITPVPGDASGEVSIDVRQIGLRITRPGEWAGFQVEVTDSGTKARNVFVRLELPDADGDSVVMQRWIVTNPGVKQSVWLYAWQPFDLHPGYAYRFTAYEAEERSSLSLATGGGSGGDASGQDRYRPVRRIGSRVFPLGQAQAVDATRELIAVVGASQAGFDQYASCRFPDRPYSPTGHELTEVVAGLKPDDLPDRWMGLAALSTIVWTGRDAEEQPSRLKQAQVEAIIEWVRRGGHLIIVMPSVGQSWFGSGVGVNPLGDIMPVVRAVPVEGVDLDQYRKLLTSDTQVTLPKNAVLHRFDPVPGAAAGPYEAMPIMKGAGGDVIVARRLVGAGAVTVVGIDLTRKEFQTRNALQTQQFWNRVLGRRLKLYPPAELNALHAGEKDRPPLFLDRTQFDFDRIINEVIAKQGKAAKGLLAAFVVFLAYWLIAGPLGYLVLKQRNRRQHAWVVFVAATSLFALIGWGATSALKLGRDVDKHYTIVDHVYGQTNQRMRSWVELTLPKYGDQRVSVRAPDTADNSAMGWHHAITSWEPGGESSSALASFPDARPYVMDTRQPDTAEFPARATTRQLQIDYAGSVPSNWGMPRPVAADGVPLGQEIYIEEPPRRPGDPEQTSERRWIIQGTLVHNLPADLHDVYVFVVREINLKDSKLADTPAGLPAILYSGKGPDAWAPGQPLALNTTVATKPEPQFFQTLRGTVSSSGFGAAPVLSQASIQLWRAAYAQAFFTMLEPPEPLKANDVWATRESTHNLDLGRWFTQPCVIVVGILGGDSAKEAVESPVPIAIDDAPGEQVRKNIRGATVIRWVYPLSPRPATAEPPPAPAESVPVAPGK
jgi:hypothetical protein